MSEVKTTILSVLHSMLTSRSQIWYTIFGALPAFAGAAADKLRHWGSQIWKVGRVTLLTPPEGGNYHGQYTVLLTNFEVCRTILADGSRDKQTDRQNHGRTHICRVQTQYPAGCNRGGRRKAGFGLCDFCDQEVDRRSCLYCGFKQVCCLHQ